MGVTVQVDPRFSALLRALGAVDSDGGFDPSWFEHPLDRVADCLNDDTQRAALFDLLDEVLPAVTGPLVPPGARWHPLLAANPHGNAYLSIHNGRIGVALAVRTVRPDLPSVQLTATLPLLRTGDGKARAEVGPLGVTVVATLPAAQGITTAGIRVAANVDGSVAVAVRLEDAAGTVTEFDPAAMDARAVRAVELLVRSVLAYETDADDAVASLVAHLPGVFGLGDKRLTTFPVADPSSVRGWLADVARDPDALTAWFTHLAGILAVVTDDTVLVRGSGTSTDPLRSPVLRVGDVAVELLLGTGGSATDPTLELGAALTTVDSTPTLAARALVAAIPLAAAPGTPTRVLPSAAALLTVPVSGGHVDGGVSWNAAGLTPVLRLRDVTIAGTRHTVDLTDANAVVATVADDVLAQLTAGLGGQDNARHLLALTGFRPADGDPRPAPPTVGAAALSGNLLHAIAEVHRAALDHPDRPWRHLFAELGGVFGLAGEVTGAGTRTSPWLLPLSGDDTYRISLAAWDDRSVTTPDGTHLLRLGLHVTTGAGPWTAAWSSELLAFDLSPSAPTRIALVGAQNLTLAFTDLAAASVWADRVEVTAHWSPGTPPQVRTAIQGLRSDAFGPVDLELPGNPGPSTLNVPIDPGDLTDLLHILLAQAWPLWGADLTGHAVAGLFGLHRDLAGVPDDWPLLVPRTPQQLTDLLADPVGALRRHATAVLNGVSWDGTPFAGYALHWLAALAAGLVPDDVDAPPADSIRPRGAGTHTDPWQLPAGDTGSELLIWQDPAPEAGPAGPVAATGLALLSNLAPGTAALRGRDLAAAAQALDDLSAWFDSGDGLVPYASQTAVPPTWKVGTPVPVGHHRLPADPAAVAQVAAHLTTWGQPPALLLVTATGTTWRALLAAIDPGHDPDARIDLRGAPEADLSTLTAVAAAYPVLLDDPGAGGLDHLVKQVDRAAARVRAVTGATRVALIGHGPGGVVARVAAAGNPAGVAGVITLAAPHAGTDLTPLTRDDVADGVRLARALTDHPTAGVDGRVAVDEAVALLGSILDGGPVADGALPPAGTYTPDGFAGVPDGLTDTLPGLAIGARLPAGTLISSLAAAVAAPPAPAEPVSHLGLGARHRFTTPLGGPGQIQLDIDLRVDLARVRTGPGPEPVRTPHEVTVTAAVTRPGGWLVGDSGVRDRAVPRVRWAEVRVRIDRDASGALRVDPVVLLHEAGRAGDDATVQDLAAIMALLRPGASSPALPAGIDGPAGDLIRALLAAAGLADSAGTWSVPALRQFTAAPTGWLGPRLPDILAVLGPAVGATPDAGGWRLPVLAGTHTLTITPAPWTLRLAGVDTPPNPPAGILGGLTADASLAFPSFAATGTATLAVGPLRLTGGAGTIDLVAPPWLPPVRLWPAGHPADVVAALEKAVPRVLLSAVLGVLAGPHLSGGVRVPPLDALLDSPGTVLRELVGTGPGMNALFDLVRSAVGVPPQPGVDGLPLPGGLRLYAVDPFAVRLSGSLALAGTTLDVDLGLALPAGQPPSPDGTLALTVPLTGGTWGGVRIVVGFSAAGVSLVLEPDNADPIAVLPHFDGLGALVAGAQALLPSLLQQLVKQLSPPGPVLAAVLRLAEALGIYGADADGFTRPDRAAVLASMLRPGWLDSVAADGPTIAGRIAALFGPPPLLPVPLGVISSSGGTVSWTVPLPTTGTLTAALGWDTSGRPVVTLTAAQVAIGPVVLESVTVSAGAQPSGRADLRLAFDGVLAPITPALQIVFDADGFAAQILPLGAGTADDFRIALAPQPAVDATVEGALDLALSWGLPLASEVILRAVTGTAGISSPLDRALWAGGPTARTLLAGASLIPAGTTEPAPRLVRPLPDPLDAVLGALRAAAGGVSVQVTDTLTFRLVHDPATGRTGLRLSGYQDIDAGDVTVSLRFGTEPWFTHPNSGVTLWVAGPGPTGGPPLQLAPGLDAVGLGVLISGEPLVDGAVVIGGAGGLLFLSATFLDERQAPALAVSGLGAGGVLVSSYLNLAANDADSFLATVLPAQLKAPFDLVVAYRDGRLEVAGTGPATTDAIELDIPLDVDLVLIHITELLLGMRAGGGRLRLEAAVSGSADVGPLFAAVRRVGIVATFGTGGTGLGFRPPDQVGLSIDSPTLRLGGHLLVDEEHGRYVGAVEIAVLGKFELSAIGIITTRMPDGSPGFSLLFLVSMTLPVPIALGYGFFLAGAGGLLGVNRGVDLDALTAGLRTGAAQRILFPTDIVRNADAIVRDLEQVFPVASDRFLISPMARITWSTPPLVTIDLGLIVGLGAPVTVAILGLLRATLPDPDNPILNLKVAFLGAIDLGASLLRFDAAIFDSYIGSGDFKVTLDGDLAVRLSWGERPDFVASIGGFHPAYRPASNLRLPTMRRLTLTLLRDNPSLVLTAYLAITANSVQFGARLNFGFSVAGFSIVGYFGFDVLIQVAPFALEADMRANLAVKSGGATILSLALDFTLHGPTPWIARGHASFRILFFSVTVAIDARFGPEQTTSIPDVAVLPKILEAFEQPASWVAELPTAAGTAVTLLPLDPTPGVIVIDAAGTLTVSQRVAPLETELTRFGTSRPNDVSTVRVDGLRLGGQPTKLEPTTEMFSPGSYRALPDADKLREDGFVPRPSGVRAAGDTAPRTDYAIVRPARYDLIVSDDPDAAATHDLGHTSMVALARGATGRSAASRALRAEAERGSVVPVGTPLDQYAVTAVGDLRPRTADGSVAVPIGTDPDGRPIFAPGVLVDRVDAQARLRTAAAAGTELQIVPAAQVVA
ncbi:hypothetical protein GA0074695_4249 [Micromonospora viridifaciens]|uniref:DUF6603 domain-containing protein n=1 Tax=Micromonospora viridifaciens TaxID=1881 RepID=A0A1C4YGF2_MICVI|nr:DUF6603 domain-containing protein [Micromonospora viridifaciens]SCF19750.1 hypothetical protein GA0074695_4249 [Micromonospora viridifaciens]